MTGVNGNAAPAPRESRPVENSPEEDAPASHLVVGASTDEAATTEDVPVGPSEDEEAAFLAEQREQGGGADLPRRAQPEEADADAAAAAPLPPLEELVNRIPAKTRELMDELFRAKFITVKRVPKSALKN